MSLVYLLMSSMARERQIGGMAVASGGAAPSPSRGWPGPKRPLGARPWLLGATSPSERLADSLKAAFGETAARLGMARGVHWAMVLVLGLSGRWCGLLEGEWASCQILA